MPLDEFSGAGGETIAVTPLEVAPVAGSWLDFQLLRASILFTLIAFAGTGELETAGGIVTVMAALAEHVAPPVPLAWTLTVCAPAAAVICAETEVPVEAV